ncbi:MAG: HEAT repeat domain-containing protein [Leptospira sp.]|nr:HEAT repeat domain-containing protein [Leptospira sp.]
MKRAPFFVLCILSSFYSLLGEESYKVNDGSDQHFHHQVQMLWYGSLEERIRAIDTLRFIRSKRAIRPIIAALKGNPFIPNSEENSPLLKFQAAKAIAFMGQEVAIKPVIEVFKLNERNVTEEDRPSFSDEEYKLVMALGEMLRTLGELELTKESFELLKASLTHKNYYIRASAADGMKSSRNKESLEPLKTAIANEKNEFARSSMLHAIISLDKNVDTYFKVFLDLLKSEDPQVRRRTSAGLGEIDIKMSEIALKKALLIEEDAIVRQQLKKDIGIVSGFKMPEIVPGI